MVKSLATTGIILKRLDYAEADRIITFLTSDAGKIRTIAKGVRKQKSKMAGGIELFSVSEIHYIKGRGDIDTLTSTRLIKHYGNIVKDLKRTEFAYEMIKRIEKTIEDGTGSEYFDILNESFLALDNFGINLTTIEVSFYMRLMQTIGQIPDFSVDKSGNKLKPDDKYEFDYSSTSFVSNQRGQYDKNHLKVLKLLAHNSPQLMRNIDGIDEYCEQLYQLVKSLQINSM